MAARTTHCETSHSFRSAAAHYRAGRPAYAALLIRRVAGLVGLGAADAVLDLGCGPGVLAHAFAPLAREVVAMDPEPEMLSAAAESCAGLGNVRCAAGGSEDLAPSLGQFRLVVMGRSFHWMDRAPTLRRLDALVVPGGAVVLFHTSHAAVPANAWTERFRALRRHYSPRGDDRTGPNGAPGTDWVGHEAFLLESAFSQVEAHAVFETAEVDAARLADRAFSMSGTTRARLGDRAAELERDIADMVREVAAGGRLTEVIESTALIARRPGEETAS